MGTLLIDKLLHAVVKQGASDLHVAVGQPPVLRLHGRMRKLETKSLEPDDTVALMKSIAPDRCQQELAEVGSADFGFAFGDYSGSAFRSSSSAAMSGWCCGKFPTSF
jgi:twitching motility protein PilT